MAHIIKAGAGVIRAHLEHLEEHGETGFLQEARAFLQEKKIPVPDRKTAEREEIPFHGCPGSRTLDRCVTALPTQKTKKKSAVAAASQLRTWPVQLQLVNPQASFFADADLLVAADCVPFALAGFHSQLLEGKIPVIFCPKLDRTIDLYLAKLTAIFKQHSIRSITVVRMEVPCCGTTTELVRQALADANVNIPVSEQIISVGGDILK